MADEPKEPKPIVTILKSGKPLEARSFTFDHESTALSVSDWLAGNGVDNTRMSKRAYDLLIKNRNERENPKAYLDRYKRPGNE